MAFNLGLSRTLPWCRGQDQTEGDRGKCQCHCGKEPKAQLRGEGCWTLSKVSAWPWYAWSGWGGAQLGLQPGLPAVMRTEVHQTDSQK